MDISDFSFVPWSLAAGFVFGVFGWWVFSQGRKKENNRLIWLGVGMMIYPYFIDGAWANWAVGAALCGLAYYIW